MPDFMREALRWLIGGGAVALATLLGTTAYQQGQLEIEREKNLRQFLDKYVEIAVNGTLDERIRFVSYWESLEVSDRIGVDFARYREALLEEIEAGLRNAEAQVGAAPPGPAEPAGPGPSSPDPAVETPPRAGEPPATEPAGKPAVEARPQVTYYESRKSQVERLGPAEFERQALEALLARDARRALAALGRAADLWPTYHNVAEIETLLEKELPKLAAADSPRWKEIYRIILERYSWGIPPDLRKELEAAAR